MKNFDSNDAFLGTGWSFPPSFQTHNRQVKMVSYEQDIQESLHILLSTKPGERVMQPAFGCELKTMIFEIITESLITRIKDAVERAILFFEPRITLESVEVQVDTDPSEEQSIYDGVLYIYIEYTIRKTNTRSNMVYPYYFFEGTNVQF
jgi:phage baseplate assembly protein W